MVEWSVLGNARCRCHPGGTQSPDPHNDPSPKVGKALLQPEIHAGLSRIRYPRAALHPPFRLGPNIGESPKRTIWVADVFSSGDSSRRAQSRHLGGFSRECIVVEDFGQAPKQENRAEARFSVYGAWRREFFSGSLPRARHCFRGRPRRRRPASRWPWRCRCRSRPSATGRSRFCRRRGRW